MRKQSLRDKTIVGVGWSATGSLLSYGITFLVGLVLARLLSPDEYGLIGIVTIFISLVDAVVDGGFSDAIIRKKDPTNDDYNTMFLVNMALSFLLCFILYVFAGPIAVFFKREELVALIRVMSFSVLIHALSVTQNTVLTKRIDFKTKTKAAFYYSVGSGAIGLGMAFAGLGVWSLVGQYMSRSLIYTIYLWCVIRWKPNYRFNRDSFNYLWGFGWKVMLVNLITNVWKELNQMVVAKIYSTATLGQYSKAKEFTRWFSVNMMKVIQRVSYPVLSELQSEKERMISAYRKLIKLTFFVSVVGLFFMGAIAEPMIYCLIGPKWHEASTFLPLICIAMSIYPLHVLNINMMLVGGKSGTYLVVDIAKKVLALIPIVVGIFVDIYWMLVACIIVEITSFFLNSYYGGKTFGYSTISQIKDVFPSFVLASVIAVSVYFFKELPLSMYIILPVQLVVGVFVFLLIMKMHPFEEYTELTGIALSYRNKLHRKAMFRKS